MLPKPKKKTAGHRRNGYVGFALCVALALLLWWPRLSSYSDQLTFLDKLSFDLLCALSSSSQWSDVQIIEMDQKSFRALGQDPTLLWDRNLHARLLRKLTQDGARIVVFDVFFDTPGRQKSDEELAQAMRAHGKVAIAEDYVPVARAGIVGNEPVFPTEPLRAAAAGMGLSKVIKDTDDAVRRHFLETEYHRSLPWIAANLAGAASLAELNPLQPRWLNYYGPGSTTWARISYADALEQPDGYFRQKMVFVGGAPRIKKPGEEADTFRTPYTRWDGQAAPGVDLLATAFLNLLRNDWLTRCPALEEFALILLTGFVFGFGFVFLRPWVSGGLAIFAAVSIAGIALLLRAQGHFWFCWLLPAAAQIPAAWLWSMTCYLKGVRPATPESSQAVVGAPLMPSPVLPTIADSATTPTLLSPRVSDHDLLRCVGKGAYGEVWLARNAIGMFHAVKIIYRRAFDSEEPYEREFRGITKFMPISRSHCGFVHILHVGRDDPAGYFYYIMETADDEVSGQNIKPEVYSPKNLSKVLMKRKRLALLECVQLGMCLAESLNHLHQAQLIHRDIKPANIIYVKDTPKLADIGLVTNIAEPSKDITYLGTIGYIAPEGPGTPAADIYSLGKVLYEACTGLDREQFPNLPSTLLSTPTGGFSQLNQILLRACESNPAHRYQSASDLYQELDALRERMSNQE